MTPRIDIENEQRGRPRCEGQATHRYPKPAILRPTAGQNRHTARNLHSERRTP